MKRKSIELLLILICICLQNSLGRAISLGGVAPNILILLPVIFGYMNGSKEGMFVGFFSGLVYDAYSYNLFGFSALMYTLFGYIAGVFYEKYEDEDIVLPLIIAMISDYIFETISYFGMFMLYNDFDYRFYLNSIIIPEILYTGLVYLIIVKPLIKLNPYLNSKDKRRLNDINERDY